MTLPRRAPLPVAPAQEADTEILSQVIADAFGDLPQSRWLVPDDDARREIFPRYFRIYVEHAMASGTVHTTTDRAAAALWLPAGEDAAGLPDSYDEQLAAAAGPWVERFRAFDATLGQNHPAGPVHHHLAILAVRPGRQRRGTGSLLLRAYHDLLDQNGTPAYLEAATRRTTWLYLRHGYTFRPGAPFYLPDGGPPMWPMWRDPQRLLPRPLEGVPGE